MSEPEWDIRMGAVNHKGLKVAAPHGQETPLEHLVVEGNMRAGTLRGPKQLGLLAYDKVNNRARFFLLEHDPDADMQEVTFDECFVSGRFHIRQKINNTNHAREAFRAFRAGGASDDKRDG